MSDFLRDYDKRKFSDTSSAQSLGSGTQFDYPAAYSVGGYAEVSSSTTRRGDTSTDAESAGPPIPFIKKRFTASWAQKRRNKDDGEGVRGPVGLRLLHPSPEPLIDLIFVHGLRGGSVKTWRKRDDPRLFWPQFWLPAEPGFRNVNIHSFGYESDWASTKSSILNVHDFGQSLLEEMRNSPHLRDTGNGPIVLIGHSMGGLVIKKAYILSRDTIDLRGRIRCIFFLATPHRGSDYAALLNNILTISGILHPRDYIQDLTTGSTSAQLINEDFGRYAHDLPIYSFYETLRMSIGLSSTLIVDKNSAILGSGYINERRQLINANHRDICKFDNPDDPNYITIKNALWGAVQDLVRNITITREEETKEQMKVLKAYLGASERPDESHQKVEGSCQWIDARDDFQEWRDSASNLLSGQRLDDPDQIPSVIWVHANPGTGKTVLAAHVIYELQEFQVECAYYYFHVGSKAARSLAEFLRSIAYQMAMSNAAIRERLLRLWQEGSTFDLDDDRIIWNKIFKRGIFQAKIYTPQYWIIDAIDECSKYQEFFTMLKGEKPNFPLRIFLTSRNVPDMAKLSRLLEASMPLVAIDIPVRNSMHDIERYIESRIKNLPVDQDSDRSDLAGEILQRSNACFLWVRLVLDELENVYSTASIRRVLRGIPEGMIPYYKRTVKDMAEKKMEKHIAKAVLLWVSVSSRRMTITELSQALALDIKEELPNAKSAVEGLCGQLVSIDKQSNVVEVVHPTVREFLLSEEAGEFCISKSVAHERIALTSLKMLSSREMQPPRGRHSVAQSRAPPSPFLDYAITQFSEHVYSASSETDELLLAMDRFLRTNVLSWIERVALKGDLHCLIRTSKNLKAYLDRRAKYRSPLSDQVRNVDSWSVDLSRLVTNFGAALLHSPSSIYGLIPPLCPSDSAICRQFGKKPDGLSILGFKNKAWDDCIASVSFGDDQPVAVSCGENVIAVGMSSGEVALYNQQSCQKEGMLRNKWPVDLVHFTDKFVAICTVKNLVLQDSKGTTQWETRLRSRCILLTSAGDFIYAVTQHGHLLKWNVFDGSLEQDQFFEYRNHDTETDYNRLASRAPSVASISPDIEMLALGYRGGTVCLWDLQTAEFIGWARDDDDKLPAKMLFNPNPSIDLLLTIYTNHDLALFETWDGSLRHSVKASKEAGVQSASSSPDGRTLVTCDALMNMQVWDFESLTLLYHLESPYAPFRILSFTSDSSSIVDVTDSGMRIWSPAALVRKNIDEDASTSEDAASVATKGQYEPLRSARITALCAHPSLPVAFAGKHDGQVVAFNTKTGQQASVVYTHPQGEQITELAVSNSNLIASSDGNGVVLVRRFDPKRLTVPNSTSWVLRTRSREPVKQLCFSVNGGYVVVSTELSDRVYSLKDATLVGSIRFESGQRKVWQWIPVLGVAKDEQFLLLHDHSLQHFLAANFPSEAKATDVRLEYELKEGAVETAINSAVVHPETQTLVVDVRHDLGYVSSSTMLLFGLQNGQSPEPASSLKALCELPPELCERFIGISKRIKPGSFVFLHNNSWLSSLDPKTIESKRYTQHFFVPNEYISSIHEAHNAVRPVMTADDDVVFCLYGELVIVKNGLRFQEAKELQVKQKPISSRS